MTVLHVADIHRRFRAFQRQVSLQSFADIGPVEERD